MRIEQADVCVIGSGAGGAVIAYEAARRGMRTLLLEKGPYVRSHEMTHVEADMVPRLYKDGGLQTNRSMDVFIMQGSCVGGSTVLSNMVMLRAPRAVLESWQALGAALDIDALDASYTRIEARLGVAELPRALTSKTSALFYDGAKSLGMQPQWMQKALGNCRGCGLCNNGCLFGAKRSMLTTYVPWAEEAGARVLANTRVEQLRIDRGVVQAVECSVGPEREPVEVRARQVVVAGGAIGSSAVLLASGVKANVGTRVAFHLGALMTAEFDENLDSYDADQMNVFVHESGCLLEVTHNPILGTALLVPGWMGEHAALMRKQRRLGFAGAMTRTEPTGRVRRSWWSGQAQTDYRPTAGDLAALRAGLDAIGRIFLAAGARRVLFPTRVLRGANTAAELQDLESAIRTTHDVTLGTSHPQGGNPWSSNRRLGVVDHDFAVHGHHNLFVCDASVFPTAVGVNPVATVLALADYAAPRIFARAA